MMNCRYLIERIFFGTVVELNFQIVKNVVCPIGHITKKSPSEGGRGLLQNQMFFYKMYVATLETKF